MKIKISILALILLLFFGCGLKKDLKYPSTTNAQEINEVAVDEG